MTLLQQPEATVSQVLTAQGVLNLLEAVMGNSKAAAVRDRPSLLASEGVARNRHTASENSGQGLLQQPQARAKRLHSDMGRTCPQQPDTTVRWLQRRLEAVTVNTKVALAQDGHSLLKAEAAECNRYMAAEVKGCIATVAKRISKVASWS